MENIKQDLKDYLEKGESFKAATDQFLKTYNNISESEVKELESDQEFMDLMSRLDKLTDDLGII